MPLCVHRVDLPSRVGELDEPEVEDHEHLRVAAAVEEQVVWLDVAVDHAGVVGDVQGLHRWQQPAERPAPLDALVRLLLKDLAQTGAAQQVGHEERRVVDGPHVGDAEHVRVVDRAGGPGLAQDPLLHCVGDARELQDLDRHVAAEQFVPRVEHVRHAAAADVGDDVVAILEPVAR